MASNQSFTQKSAIIENDASLSAEARAQALLPLVDAAVAEVPGDTSEAVAVVQHAVQESVGLIVARQLLARLAQQLKARLDGDVSLSPVVRQLAGRFVDILSPRSVPFEEQIASIKELLAQALQNQENWLEAAQTLASIPLESGHRAVPDDYKLFIYTRIAALYLEAGENVSAESYVNRATPLALDTKDAELRLTVNAQLARIADTKRKFLDAARRYILLSYEIPDDQARQVSLGHAINCAVLAAAGPQRSRTLTTLYKDERTRQLPTFGILEAMYCGRIVRKPEVQAFEAQLQPHQLARTTQGNTILDQAVIQHNILSASRIYNNISFEELGHLLQISPEQAERTVVRMISEGRMQGSVDQLDKLVFFVNNEQLVTRWDEDIRQVCTEVRPVRAERFLVILSDSIVAAQLMYFDLKQT